MLNAQVMQYSSDLQNWTTYSLGGRRFHKFQSMPDKYPNTKLLLGSTKIFFIFILKAEHYLPSNMHESNDL